MPTEKKKLGKNLCKRGVFGGDSQHSWHLLQKVKDIRSQKKVTKVVYDRLVVYEKERVNHTSGTQGDS